MTTPKSDEVLLALDVLEEVCNQTERQTTLMRERIARLRTQRYESNGNWSWTTIMVEENEPTLVNRLAMTLKALNVASGGLRRALVIDMRSAGTSIPKIASLFGVSHQRVSNIIRELKPNQKAAIDAARAERSQAA